MRATKILECNCMHEYQDERYGKGQRVHNYARKGLGGDNNPGWRCTACGRVKPVKAED